MPTYAYYCRWCGWECLDFYKSLPENPEAPIPCRGCKAHDADRNFAKDAGAGFMVGNAKSEGIDKLSVLAHLPDGRAYVHDANNRPKEVRTFRDVEKYVSGKDNHLGSPRMIERVNKQTGLREMVPMRDSDGVIQRESARLVPLDAPKDRSVTAEQGDKLNERGTLRGRPAFYDPETGGPRPVTDAWVDKSEIEE